METKKCSRCKTEKSVEDFNKNASKLDGRQNRCRECDTIVGREYYQQHKEKCRKRIRQRKLDVRSWLNEYKTTLACEQCGDTRWYVLDFHHRDPAEKEIEVSNLCGYSVKRLKNEIEKCDVLCASCHRERHYLEQWSCGGNGIHSGSEKTAASGR